MRRFGRAYANGHNTVSKSNSSNNNDVTDSMSVIRSFDSEVIPTRPIVPSPLASSSIAGIPLDLLDRLRSFPLFNSAPNSFLVEIAAHLHPQLFLPHDYIITEGDKAKAIYWLVRGSVRVTSRDGESTYAELLPGAFFGEIGILMNIPRTATIIAKLKSLVVRLNQEELRQILPRFPDVERAILDEAKERLAILQRKKKNELKETSPTTGDASTTSSQSSPASARGMKRPRDGENSSNTLCATPESETSDNDPPVFCKKRKSPSPSLAEAIASSALCSGSLNVRQLLREFPLFSTLPAETLHSLGLNAIPRSYPPFYEIVKQGTEGRDVYFIVRGEVEVINEDNDLASTSTMDILERHAVRVTLEPSSGTTTHIPRSPGPIKSNIKARLKSGQYFGEVTSLSLAPRRTATVRSVTCVECLIISGDVLNSLWQSCPVWLRVQMENTAHERMINLNDIIDIKSDEQHVEAYTYEKLTESSEYDLSSSRPTVLTGPYETSRGKFTDAGNPLEEEESRATCSTTDLKLPLGELDLGIHSEDFVSKTRTKVSKPQSLSKLAITNNFSAGLQYLLKNGDVSPAMSNEFGSKTESLVNPLNIESLRFTPPSDHAVRGKLNKAILIKIFRQLDIGELMRLRLVSSYWMQLLTTSPEILHTVDLSTYNRSVTDYTVKKFICPFIRCRPKIVDISNCFHLTDEGFSALVEACGSDVRIWKMKSVWEVTGQTIWEMVNFIKGLEEINFSNCRKVGDNLLARIVGWVIPEVSPVPQAGGSLAVDGENSTDNGNDNAKVSNDNEQSGVPNPSISESSNICDREQNYQDKNLLHDNSKVQDVNTTGSQSAPKTLAELFPPGTIIGCPNLTKLTLSYCKHVTDKFMTHLAQHASDRLEELDLTRCTTITDIGFQQWSIVEFPRLTKLCLADCTYLTDNAMIWLTHAAKGLRELNLSFCCALSDISTEVLALRFSTLTYLNMAFCGSAVSDASMRAIGLYLLELQYLSVRGCVRVTGIGVEAILMGCRHLKVLDVSQCKNLRPWLESGGINQMTGDRARLNFEECEIRHELIPDTLARLSS